ncbi:MAG: transposase [Clostridia bacterium]|nr:transposase [Clostridia bacterium]
MPRIARKNSSSCFYHVMVQGINKEHIFKDEKWIEKYKKFMQEKLEESEVTILAYCVMINHVHLLIHSDSSANLSKYMQKLNSAYSKFYNVVNERIGYVFRDRFRSQEICSERQLYTCLKYIHNNPVKANIVSFMYEYPYSSYNEFVNEKDIITKESIKLLFNTEENYMEQFNKVHLIDDEENIDEFIDLKEKDVLDFIYEIENKYGRKISEIKKDKSLLRKVIKAARMQTDVTLVKLASILNVSKSTVENYERKKWKKEPSQIPKWKKEPSQFPKIERM